MNSSTAETIERTPLDQIRQAEAEVTRRVAAARQAAGAVVQEAQAQAADLKRQACETGQREGQAQYRESISQAEEEARVLVEQAHRRAGILRHQGDLCMDDFVRLALKPIIGRLEQ